MSRRRSSDSPIYDFLTFRLMITPMVIAVIFWVGTLACVATGFRMVVLSFDQPALLAREADRDRDRELERFLAAAKKGDKSASAAEKVDKPPAAFAPMLFAGGLAVMVLGPVFVRIACELDIILFSIHDELKAANDRARYTG